MAIRTVDVVIVGAGLSGLMAARLLQRRGLQVQVLEARSAVGGRMRSTTTHNGTVVDLGGQWGGATHHRLSALVEELGLERFPSHYSGDGVLCWQGARIQAPLADSRGDTLLFFDPAALNLAPGAWESTSRLQRAFLALVGRIDPQRPWRTADAERLDRTSVAAWSAAQTDEPLASLPLSWLCRVGGSGGFEPWEASILHLAWTQAVAPQAESPEAWLLRGGAGAVAQRLAEQLRAAAPESILLQAPVRLVRQDSRGVEVSADFGPAYRARAVVVAVPPQQRLGIRFEPALPPAHNALLQRSAMGAMTKILAVYERAFWRDEGLNGLGISDLHALELTADSSPPEGSPGILAGFASGERAARLMAMDAAQQQTLIRHELTTLWGPQAANPVELLVQPWTAEPWIGGAFTSFPAPGAWTSHGALAAGEHGGPGPAHQGRVVWAGTEASPRWPGYFEGALEAAELAAQAAADWCLTGNQTDRPG